MYRHFRRVHLGRWEHRLSESKKDLKAVYANSDHCGAPPCKDPLVTRRVIEDEKLVDSTESFDEQYVNLLLTNELYTRDTLMTDELIDKSWTMSFK